jgi:hypothetical protein
MLNNIRSFKKLPSYFSNKITAALVIQRGIQRIR